MTIAKRLRGILTTVMAHQISQTRQNEPVDDRLLEVIMTINRDKRILIFFSLAFFFFFSCMDKLGIDENQLLPLDSSFLYCIHDCIGSETAVAVGVAVGGPEIVVESYIVVGQTMSADISPAGFNGGIGS